MKIQQRLRNLEYNYEWLRVINSPFVRLKWEFKWYKKPTAGTPYFLPRKIKNNKFVPIKYFGISYWSLGWKTKWEVTDIRFEWGPGLSIVLFGTQVVIYPVPNCDSNATDEYWESFLVYHLHTDKSKSVEERLKQCMKIHPAVWIKNNNERINYYSFILKDKYKYLVNEYCIIYKEK